MTRIVAIGECMVELAPLNAQRDFRMGFAGDTLNTAWYLSKLLNSSGQVDYVTAVGTDNLSDQMVRFLDHEGIGTRYIMRRPDRSVGLYMIQLHDGERSFSYWRGQSAARTLAQNADELSAALDGADVVYFSGITLAILPDKDRVVFLEVLQSFRKAGGTVVFDTNLRPNLWPDTETMTETITTAAQVCDMILPSFDDEAVWFADPTPHHTAQRYADLGARVVIVKNGSGEIQSLCDGKASLHTPVQVDTVIDSTAAGDSFNAGFLAGWITEKPLDDAIHMGAQLAARVVAHRGALVAEAI
ncbi:sugar kinase [Marivita sp. XM-24bin2]|uniref:sugar kinase n=1 Tax=unclassified Marivita TaxID=2632480 RepID=UPI000D7B5168|nr:sugar kinase [Marivita sp. XM-24bin2]MCR9108972.1 sugar kinase [Paracoccaceae bacterium]PWL36724.1 MAG: 2-dehydro-3-deoxygluconokinase [Marivita sp. XM-24bin2]